MAQVPPPPPPPDWPAPHGAYGPPPQGGYGAPPYWVTPPPGPAPGLGYAGFWIRAVAYLIDGILLDVPILIVLLAVIGSSSGSISCHYTNTAIGQSFQCTGLGGATAAFGFVWLLLLLISFVYFAGMWAWQGQTLGQKALGLHVVDANTGLRISLGRALLRFFGIIISSWALLIGLIWAAFDPRKQGWHDKIASTFVVKRT